MGNAARHREREPEPPPDDAAAVIAELRRIGVETDEIIARMRTIDGGPQLVVESISLAAHHAEMREALEGVAARLAQLSAVHQMGVDEGRRLAEREAAERAAAEQPRPRHRHRKPHLTVLTGSVAAASIAAVTASAGVTIAAQDSASVHPAAAAASHAAFRRMPPDSAAPVPSWSPSSRPSAKPSVAVRSARPAPSVTVAPSFTPPPDPAPTPAASSPAPPPAPVDALLVAPSFLNLGGIHFGTLPLTAAGSGEVAWTATATDGIQLKETAGVVVSGQTVNLEVTDPTGNGGWIYLTAGRQALTVHVIFEAPAATR